jgi:hypothetical protein
MEPPKEGAKEDPPLCWCLGCLPADGRCLRHKTQQYIRPSANMTRTVLLVNAAYPWWACFDLPPAEPLPLGPLPKPPGPPALPPPPPGRPRTSSPVIAHSASSSGSPESIACLISFFRRSTSSVMLFCSSSPAWRRWRMWAELSCTCVAKSAMLPLLHAAIYHKTPKQHETCKCE